MLQNLWLLYANLSFYCLFPKLPSKMWSPPSLSHFLLFTAPQYSEPLVWASGYVHSDLCSCPTCDPSSSKTQPFPLGNSASQINLNHPFSSLRLYTYPKHPISPVLHAVPVFTHIAQNTSIRQLDQCVCVCMRTYTHRQVYALPPLGSKHPISPDSPVTLLGSEEETLNKSELRLWWHAFPLCFKLYVPSAAVLPPSMVLSFLQQLLIEHLLCAWK